METNARVEARRYYSDSLFSNLLSMTFKKYKGQNGVRGFAKFKVQSLAEAERMQSYFGSQLRRLIHPGDILEVHLKAFEEELKHGYQLDIPELYELLYGKQLLTKAEEKQLKEEVWLNIFKRVNTRFKQEYGTDLYTEPYVGQLFNWFERLEQGKAEGYRVLKSVIYKGGGEEELYSCARALWELFFNKEEILETIGSSTSKIELSIFADYITRNPHAFDWKNPVGRLLWYALHDIYNHQVNHDIITKSEKLIGPEFMRRRQIYRNFGVWDDDLSSFAYVFAGGFIYGCYSRTVSLNELESYTEWPEYQSLYIVENPKVFSFLVDELLYFLGRNGLSFEQLPSDFPALLCTAGQPRSALKLFIARSIETNPECIIHYSGDFDWAGLQIKQVVAHLGNHKPWNMDSQTYATHTSKGNLQHSKHERIMLENMTGDLAQKMAQIGDKVFQESITKKLKSDLLEVIRMKLQ